MQSLDDKAGYTLIELMIVVAIIGILASVAIPKFAQTVRNANEATTLGNLGVLRSALAIYNAETEGGSPSNFSALTPKYLAAIPPKFTPPYHPAGNTVGYGTLADMTDAHEDWFYFNVVGDPNYGRVVVNCVHSDLKGNMWSSY